LSDDYFLTTTTGNRRLEMKQRFGIIELSAWRDAKEATGENVAEPALAPPAYLSPDFVPVPKAKRAEYGIVALRKKWRLSETTLGRLATFIGWAAGPKDMGEGDWETELLPNGWTVLMRISTLPPTRLDLDSKPAAHLMAWPPTPTRLDCDSKLAAYLRASWQQ
jgi:hypothetical protein